MKKISLAIILLSNLLTFSCSRLRSTEAQTGTANEYGTRTNPYPHSNFGGNDKMIKDR